MNQDLTEKIKTWDEMLRSVQQSELKTIQSSGQDQTLLTFISDVKRDLCLQMLISVHTKQLTITKSKQLVKDFYSLLPVNTREEFIQKLDSLGKQYPQARELFVKYGTQHAEETKSQVLKNVAEHLRKGNVDAAITMMKGGQSQ